MYGSLYNWGDTKTLYKTHYVMKLPENSTPSHRISPYYENYTGKSQLQTKYDGVNPNRTNVWISVSKMLSRPKLNIKTVYMHRAVKLAWRQLQSILVTGVCLKPTITPDTSSALWWREFGLKTKEEVLDHPVFQLACHLCRNGERMYPPYAISGKRELLLMDEILMNKIRTFLMSSMELLVDSKYLYEEQNNLMKKLQPAGIRYGITFQNGGFDSMIKEMLDCDFFWMGDVSKWDRQLSHIQEAQDLRNKGLKEYYKNEPMIWDSIKELTQRVSEYKSKHPLLMPDGSVVEFSGLEKDKFFDDDLNIGVFGKYESGWAQMSGDSDTTTNNCIVHQLYNNYLLISACPEATDDEICDQKMNKFGDDILGGNTNQFIKLSDESFVRENYKELGLDLKAGSFKVSKRPEGLSFLGATCTSFVYKGERYYVPSYSRDRVLAGWNISCDTLDADDELMKCFSLLELGWEHTYDELSAYIRYLFKVIPDSPVKRSFLHKGIPSQDQLKFAWAGIVE